MAQDEKPRGTDFERSIYAVFRMSANWQILARSGGPLNSRRWMRRIYPPMFRLRMIERALRKVSLSGRAPCDKRDVPRRLRQTGGSPAF
jgi:hypothetical protein